MRVDVDGHGNPPSCMGQAARIGNLVQDSPGEFAQAAAVVLRPVVLPLLCRFLDCAGIACLDRILDPSRSGKPSFVGVLREPVAWTLDALATATLIYAAILKIKAIGLPAMKAHMMKAEFLNSAFQAQLQDK
ncbi:hypothetical protein [Roseibium album]|uniref:hypothetical protein n=1 Tax=Roseibium album TaxID=311410 RepID=UPI003919AF55